MTYDFMSHKLTEIIAYSCWRLRIRISESDTVSFSLRHIFSLNKKANTIIIVINPITTFNFIKK